MHYQDLDEGVSLYTGFELPIRLLVPAMFFFEMLGPLIELTGLVLLIVAYSFGLMEFHAFTAFLILALGMGLLLSCTALLLEEMSYRIYRRPGDLLRLFLVSVIENFGYRQLNSYWRLVGLLRWLFRTESKWGVMKRNAKRISVIGDK